MPKNEPITRFDPKAGQHKLRDIWKGAPNEILFFFRETYSVTTAEEFISIITCGLPKPDQINEKQWNELVALAEAVLPAKMLRICKTRSKRKFALGVKIGP